MAKPEERCINDIIAISRKDYLRYGCPHCGFLPPDSLSEDWTLVGDAGDIGECLKCKQAFVVLADGQEFSPFIIESDCHKNIRPQLAPHPRQGIPCNHDFSGLIDSDQLPIGAIHNALLKQAQTAA